MPCRAARYERAGRCANGQSGVARKCAENLKRKRRSLTNHRIPQLHDQSRSKRRIPKMRCEPETTGFCNRMKRCTPQMHDQNTRYSKPPRLLHRVRAVNFDTRAHIRQYPSTSPNRPSAPDGGSHVSCPRLASTGIARTWGVLIVHRAVARRGSMSITLKFFRNDRKWLLFSRFLCRWRG